MPFVTTGALRKLAPNAKRDIINGIVGPLNKYMPQYGINQPLRVAHFLSQAAHEAAGFKTLTEYASGAAYEGRRDLGNTQPGDGRRFKGRGIFQLTGRANYRIMGKRLGLDLEGNPELAADPTISVRIACEYWQTRNLNAYADADDVNGITRKINGGYNGLADRKRYLAKAKELFKAPLPPDVDANAPEPAPKGKVPAPKTTGTVAGAGTAVVVAKQSGMSWTDALSIGVGVVIFAVLVFVIVKALRGKE